MPVLARAPEPQTRSDLEHAPGVWISVAGPREARLLVAGNRFTFEFVGGDIYMGTFDLGPDEMDMQIEEGPRRTRGQDRACASIRLEGGVLRWCPGRPGSDRRPTAFPHVDDPRYLSFVFRQTRRHRAAVNEMHSPSPAAYIPPPDDAHPFPSLTAFSLSRGRKGIS